MIKDRGDGRRGREGRRGKWIEDGRKNFIISKYHNMFVTVTVNVPTPCQNVLLHYHRL